MPKFTATLHEEGDHVVVTAGPYAGEKGTVIGWSHVGSQAPDTMHLVKLDTPKQVIAEKETTFGGRTISEREPVTLTQIEVPSSALIED